MICRPNMHSYLLIFDRLIIGSRISLFLCDRHYSHRVSVETLLLYLVQLKGSSYKETLGDVLLKV